MYKLINGHAAPTLKKSFRPHSEGDIWHDPRSKKGIWQKEFEQLRNNFFTEARNAKLKLTKHKDKPSIDNSYDRLNFDPGNMSTICHYSLKNILVWCRSIVKYRKFNHANCVYICSTHRKTTTGKDECGTRYTISAGNFHFIRMFPILFKTL